MLELVAEKQKLVAQANSAAAMTDRKQRHDAIESVNQRLQPYLEGRRNELVSRREFFESRLRTSQILGSREFSFALFPGSIIDTLKGMAT